MRAEERPGCCTPNVAGNAVDGHDEAECCPWGRVSAGSKSYLSTDQLGIGHGELFSRLNEVVPPVFYLDDVPVKHRGIDKCPR